MTDFSKLVRSTRRWFRDRDLRETLAARLLDAKDAARKALRRVVRVMR